MNDNELIATKLFGLVKGQDFGEFPEHQWCKNEDNTLEYFTVESCEGLLCDRCTLTFCPHCEPEGPTEKCIIYPPNYKAPIYSNLLRRQLEHKGYIFKSHYMHWNKTYYTSFEKNFRFTSGESTQEELAIFEAAVSLIKTYGDQL